MGAERPRISEQTVRAWRNRDGIHDHSHMPHLLQMTLTTAAGLVDIAGRVTVHDLSGAGGFLHDLTGSARAACLSVLHRSRDIHGGLLRILKIGSISAFCPAKKQPIIEFHEASILCGLTVVAWAKYDLSSLFAVILPFHSTGKVAGRGRAPK